ncbi:hypothetical protein [Nocardia thraciensis]
MPRRTRYLRLPRAPSSRHASTTRNPGVVGQPTDGRSREEIRRRAPELLKQVGLRPEHADRYPADFSGGQKQRIPA